MKKPDLYMTMNKQEARAPIQSVRFLKEKKNSTRGHHDRRHDRPVRPPQTGLTSVSQAMGWPGLAVAALQAAPTPPAQPLHRSEVQQLLLPRRDLSGIRDDDEAWFCVLRSIVSAVYLVGLLKLCTAYANMKQSWG